VLLGKQSKDAGFSYELVVNYNLSSHEFVIQVADGYTREYSLANINITLS
jgi:hypothetical protein